MITTRNSKLPAYYSRDSKDVLGQGTYGTVFKGQRKKDGTPVAIKRLQKSALKKNKKQVKNLEREVEVMQNLKHPFLVPLLDVFEDKSYVSVVLEFCPDGDLLNYLNDIKSPISERRATTYLRQILSAIRFLHSHGVVHRDIKPENLLLCENKEVCKIADFGFSINSRSTGGVMKTMCGSITHMAPEIFSKKGYDKRIDIWAVGIVSYVMLQFGYPFEGSNTPELVRKISQCEYEFTDKYKISAEAKNFVEKLLQANPDDRMTIEGCLDHPFLEVDTSQIPEISEDSVEEIGGGASMWPGKYYQCVSSPETSICDTSVPLPPGWVVKISNKRKPGQEYYVNTATETRSWTKPVIPTVFRVGDIIEAIKESKTNDTGNKTLAVGEQFMVQRMDELGDMAINKLPNGWMENSWIAAKNFRNFKIVETNLHLALPATDSTHSFPSRGHSSGLSSLGSESLMKNLQLALPATNSTHCFPSRRNSTGLSSRNSESVGMDKQDTIRRTFKMYDEDQNGTIDMNEFCNALCGLGINMGEEKLLELFQSIDADGSGAIDYGEFQKAALQYMDGDTDVMTDPMTSGKNCCIIS